MDLSQLPSELLWIIPFYLLGENDVHVFTFVRTNCRLYQELKKCLSYWNAQYGHGSAFVFTTENNLFSQLKNLLVALDVARTKPHSRSRDPI